MSYLENTEFSLPQPPYHQKGCVICRIYSRNNTLGYNILRKRIRRVNLSCPGSSPTSQHYNTLYTNNLVYGESDIRHTLGYNILRQHGKPVKVALQWLQHIPAANKPHGDVVPIHRLPSLLAAAIAPKHSSTVTPFHSTSLRRFSIVSNNTGRMLALSKSQCQLAFRLGTPVASKKVKPTVGPWGEPVFRNLLGECGTPLRIVRRNFQP